MPKYMFECQGCSTRFERTLKMGDYTTHECPGCKDQAPRVLDGESFAFAFAQGAGAPANSGVHDHDYPSADKAVGRSAEQRWALLKERDKVKEAARKQGETHALIRHTGPDYIDYEPMSDVGLNGRRRLAKEAIETVRANRGPEKPGA